MLHTWLAIEEASGSSGLVAWCKCFRIQKTIIQVECFFMALGWCAKAGNLAS